MNTAIPNFNELACWLRHSASCGWSASEGTGVGATDNKPPYTEVIRNSIKCLRLTGDIRKAGEISSKVLPKVMGSGWLWQEWIAVRAIRSVSSEITIQVPRVPRFDIASDNLWDVHCGLQIALFSPTSCFP